MYRPIPLSLQPSPAVRSAGALAAVLASFCAIGTIDAMALHCSRLQQASPLVRATDAFRCGSPHDAMPIQSAS
jgi:hypothetical protein